MSLSLEDLRQPKYLAAIAGILGAFGLYAVYLTGNFPILEAGVAGYVSEYVLNILHHTLLFPIVFVAASVGLVKYSMLIDWPIKVNPEYQNRVVIIALAIDAVLLAVSYYTGLLGLPFGITIPTADLSGLPIGQAQIALLIGIAGIFMYVVLYAYHRET